MRTFWLWVGRISIIALIGFLAYIVNTCEKTQSF